MNQRIPQNMAVIGGGTMGVGIAYVFAVAGWQVYVVEPDGQRAKNMQKILQTAVEAGLKRGKLTPSQAQYVCEGVQCLASIQDLPRFLDLVIESIPERLDLKTKVLADVAQRQPRLVATNTSALSISELAKSVIDPSSFLGMHFFNPVWSLPMVELIRGNQTSEAALVMAREFAQSTGKTTITVRDVPGFATSRLDLIASLEAMRMLEDGVATAEDIDHALVTAYRHPIGPLRLSDIVGLDVRLDIARHLSQALGPRYAPPRILEEMVTKGHLGQKTGQGFFAWPQNH
ncbi:MAG: 3-hydroxybutyryl-CoA dehydrogenase [Betaproteobacteria bacterium]|nr:3-hydroxybutyryl-CoA dehydrogenase [Betaproteobacteria bacterium]